jgi:PTH1 family peptidyl-tRNA hydrolase
MYLLVGLGNPGAKYKNNRHNVGFLFVDFLTEKDNPAMTYNNLQRDWKKDQLFHSELLKTTIYKIDFIIAKPQTFMNATGMAVQKLSKAHNIHPSQIIVVHDDLDIPFGKFKIQFASGPKIHNGINSIQQHLKTADFWRIRIGVDNRNPENQLSGEEYVLQDFSSEEKQVIPEIFRKITAQLPLQIA